MILLVLLYLHPAASICVKPNGTLPAPAFPKYPTEFRARIKVSTYGPEVSGDASLTNQNYTSTIDQVYKKSGSSEQGSVIFRDSVLGTAGYIRDVEHNHELWFTDDGCMIKDIDSLYDDRYEPFHFGDENATDADDWGFHDVWKWMDSTDNNRKVYSGEEECDEGVTCHLYLWCLTESITFAAYTTDHDVVRVEIVTNTGQGSTRRVFDYRSALSTVPVTREDFLPPPGIFCTSELEVDIPGLEPFYRLDMLLLEGWNISYDAHRVITYSEYLNEGLISVRYPATVGKEILHKRIVHNFNTGTGHIISEKQGLCMAYNAGAEYQDSFEEDILGLTEIAQDERQLVEPIWEVLKTLKKGNASPNKRAYRGLITRHGLNVDVWEIGFKDYVAEIAFTKSLHTVPKGNQALQRRLPVSLTIYNSDYKQLAEFDVIEYSAQDNNVDGLYDVSECYSTNKTLLIQFRLSIPYEKVHEFGVGSFVQGTIKSLISITEGAHYQFSHMTIAPVGRVQAIVIFTLSQTEEMGAVPMQLIVTRLREAIDGQTMYITVADYDRKQVQSILPIAQSLLVFDTVNIFQHPWQVSVSATISACLGTSFFALLLGALASHWWNRRKLFKTEVRSPTYSKFEDEEDEEEGASAL